MKVKILAIVMVGLVGLVASLASTPYSPPADREPPEPVAISQGVDQEMRIAVGGTQPGDAPPATIALWVIEPARGTPIRGTVLFLHGFLANHMQVENAAEALRNGGYRAVLIDARGFGASTGSHITFGATDSQDLSQIITELQKKNLCGKSVGVYGTSMGAATSILLAGADPRVAAVVAVAPFASIREEVTPFSRNALGTLGSYLNDKTVNSMANLVSDVAGLDLDTAKPIEAITKTRAKILLIHGDADTIIPHAASEQLHAKNPDTELLTIPGRGHLQLCFDLAGQLQPATRKWFDNYLAKH
jgi:pimeloyl-ACP methyl ester carboxylesterase